MKIVVLLMILFFMLNKNKTFNRFSLLLQVFFCSKYCFNFNVEIDYYF